MHTTKSNGGRFDIAREPQYTVGNVVPLTLFDFVMLGEAAPAFAFCKRGCTFWLATAQIEDFEMEMLVKSDDAR